MPGAMRKMAVYLGLVEDDTYDDETEYEDARREVRTSRDRRGAGGYDSGYDRQVEDDRYSSRSVRPIPDSRAVRTFRADTTERRATTAPLADRGPVEISRIEMVHPRSYNDARRIGEDFRDGVPVIMNLSELEDADAKRIIDFAAGLIFGLHGAIEKVANKVFLLSPANVDVGAQARAQLAEDGFFNQS